MTLLIGIIGCGAITRNAHLPVLSRLRSAKVVAIADEDRDALDRAASMAPDAKRFSSGDALIRSGIANAVLICTPAPSHCDITITAFEAGLDVYLEKPIANTVGEASGILDAWKRSGKIAGIGFNYRFNPLYAKLREALNAGRVGSITNISSTFRIPRPAPSWRSSRAAGGGALLDLGSHHVDLIRFLTGDEIESVEAIIESRQTEHDYAKLALTLRRGVTATVVAEYGEKFDHTFRINGTAGSAYIDIASSFEVEYPTDGNAGRRSFSPARIAHLYRKLSAPANEPSYSPALSSFVNAVITRQPASPDLADGFASLEVIDAAERSAASGQSVAITNR